jgi:hypothetical protein
VVLARTDRMANVTEHERLNQAIIDAVATV